jgi:GH25 family lysozyme M1 (1,4-beta-N-acetylmuramidase)
MPDLVIVDVSEFQPGIDHAALVAGLRAQYGGAVAICRVNYGTGHVDGQIDRNIDGFRAAGADALGLYCYLVAGQDPVAQAEMFARVVLAHAGLRANEFVVCDDEEGAGDQSGRVDAFLDRCDASLRESAGQDAWYSGLSFSITHNLPAARGHRWVAAYGAPEPSAPHDLWQFTDRQSLPGIAGPCDASVFHGSIADFLALIGGLNVAQLDEIQAAVNRADATLNQQTFGATDPSGKPMPMGWTVSYTHTLAVGLDAKVSQLLGDDDKVNQAVSALTGQMQSQGAALQAAQTAITSVKAEVDAVQAAIQGAGGAPIDLSRVYAELATLGKHVGVDVTIGTAT